MKLTTKNMTVDVYSKTIEFTDAAYELFVKMAEEKKFATVTSKKPWYGLKQNTTYWSKCTMKSSTKYN